VTTAWRRVLVGVPLLSVVAGLAVFALFFTSVVSTTSTPAAAGSCRDPGTQVGAQGGQSRLNLTPEQLGHARTIIDVGQRLQIPSRGWVIAIATALQESTLRNLPNGDRDSVGLFQQRNAWGSFAERTDPAASAEMFYTGGRAGQRGLLDISGWQQLSLTRAAQAVQVSAFPLAYAKWESLATALIGNRASLPVQGTAACQDLVFQSLPSGPVGQMLQVALAQIDDPYVFGATGPDAFDCSGLIVYSWRQVGYQLSVRTAAAMFDLSTPVAPGAELPGDLYFGDFNGRVRGAGHVMIVVKPGLAVQAPHTGDVVKLFKYRADAPGWRLGRLPTSALSPLGGLPPL
jgi:peptidoglycan DL-endopeptidase CwlO